MTTDKTTLKQDIAYYEFVRTHPHAIIVERPQVSYNITFGPCVYFTVKYGESYAEYGIKPNGVTFEVR